MIFIFGLIFTYSLMCYQIREEFSGLNKNSSYLDVIYFVSTTLSTIGYGDIYPASWRSKLLIISLQFIVIIDVLNIIFG